MANPCGPEVFGTSWARTQDAWKGEVFLFFSCLQRKQWALPDVIVMSCLHLILMKEEIFHIDLVSYFSIDMLHSNRK